MGTMSNLQFTGDDLAYLIKMMEDDERAKSEILRRTGLKPPLVIRLLKTLEQIARGREDSVTETSTGLTISRQ